MTNHPAGTAAPLRARFFELHRSGTFVMPNAWDVGSARLLATIGFPAIATTSSGHAASLGKVDQRVTLDELVGHATSMAAAVDVPVSVDSERCFASDLAGIATTVERLAAAGASGVSIEDYDPDVGIEPVGVAATRVAAAAEAAHGAGMVLTARAENHLYGIDDLDDTIGRLIAYRDAGADVLYAPGLVARDDLARVVDEVGSPINVLARPGHHVDALAALGVRRVSTGGALAFAAYGTLARVARQLFAGEIVTDVAMLSAADRNAAFSP